MKKGKAEKAVVGIEAVERALTKIPKTAMEVVDKLRLTRRRDFDAVMTHLRTLVESGKASVEIAKKKTEGRGRGPNVYWKA